MLLSVTSRPGISTFGYNKNNKKLYVAQQMAPPSPRNGTPNSSSGSGGNDQLSKTNLYIRGLQPSTTDQDLVKLCQPYGKIVSTKAILDKTTNKCKGYGFVDFDSPSSAQKAVTALKASGVQAQMAKHLLTPCFANLLMVGQRNDRTKESLCKMDGPGQGTEIWVEWP